jgi:hypothetical protein
MWSLGLHISLDRLLLSWAFEADRKTELSTWNVGATEIADCFLERHQKSDKLIPGEF